MQDTQASGRDTTTRELPLDDPEALGHLLMDLEPRLMALALRLVRNREAARDVVQTAFEKALRHGSRFRGDARVSTWMHRIVANEALMWLRSQGRREQRSVGLESLAEDALPDPGPDAGEQLEQRRTQRRVQAAIAALPDADRYLLLDCVLHDRSYLEFGRERGIHPGALKSRAFRARRRLERILAS